MAVTLAKTAEINEGGTKIVFGILIPDSSFAAGGETIDPKQCGLTTLLQINFSNVAGYSISWNGSTSAPKVQAYYGGAASTIFDAADTADLSLLPIPFVAIGH